MTHDVAAAPGAPGTRSVIIRKEQLRAFTEASTPGFEGAMIRHVLDFSPLLSRWLDTEDLRTLVRAALERARRHGFTQRATVQFYIEAVLLLGIDFDTDPQYPWGADLLGEPDAETQTERADRVHAALMTFLETVGGPAREYADGSLRALQRMLLGSDGALSPAFTDDLTRQLGLAYPEKAAYIGDPCIHKLIDRAVDESNAYGASTRAGISLLTAIMFVEGHGCTHDPRLPWIAATLSPHGTHHPAERVERLHAKWMTYLDDLLDRGYHA